jgi:hypothetical protein
MAILSESYQIHTRVHLRKYLDAIRKSGLTLNLGKCHWAQREIVYVGHLVGGGKHRPDPAKLLPILELKPPETKKQLRQMLGVLGFYRLYISGFADLSKCLTDLTSKNKPNLLKWSNIEQTAFDELKHRVCTAPVLSTPRCGEPFVLYTDASIFAVGCCLAQNDESGQEHPIAYGSQKLTNTQSAWSTIEREAYAIIWALAKYQDIIFGCHIMIFSDHNPLTYLTENIPKSAKLTRWTLALQEYDITLKYNKGKLNVLADGLSRLGYE